MVSQSLMYRVTSLHISSFIVIILSPLLRMFNTIVVIVPRNACITGGISQLTEEVGIQ